MFKKLLTPFCFTGKIFSNVVSYIFNTVFLPFININPTEKFITDKNYVPDIKITELSVCPNMSDSIDSLELFEFELENIKECLRTYIQNKLESIYIHENLEDCAFPIELEIVKNCKIYVSFKFGNNYYFMCINDIENFKKNKNLKKLSLSKRIISAVLIKLDGTHEDVLEDINKYHGPDHNFYGNLSGVSNKFYDIFINYELSDYSELIINDLFGDTHFYDLEHSDHIEWHNNFKN